MFAFMFFPSGYSVHSPAGQYAVSYNHCSSAKRVLACSGIYSPTRYEGGGGGGSMARVVTVLC